MGSLKNLNILTSQKKKRKRKRKKKQIHEVLQFNSFYKFSYVEANTKLLKYKMH